MSIFPATIGRFDAPADRANIDGLVHWIRCPWVSLSGAKSSPK